MEKPCKYTEVDSASSSSPSSASSRSSPSPPPQPKGQLPFKGACDRAATSRSESADGGQPGVPATTDVGGRTARVEDVVVKGATKKPDTAKKPPGFMRPPNPLSPAANRLNPELKRQYLQSLCCDPVYQATIKLLDASVSPFLWLIHHSIQNWCIST